MTAAINVYACYTVKIYTIQPPPPQKKNSHRGQAPGAPVLDPPLAWSEEEIQSCNVSDVKHKYLIVPNSVITQRFFNI